MFKLGSLEQELFENMKVTLSSNQIEEQRNFNKIAQALDLLNSASEIFDRAELTSESDNLLSIIQEIGEK